MDEQDVRLIDANKLIAMYERWLTQLTPREDGDRNGVENCLLVLRSSPTIEPDSMRPHARRLNPSECGGNMFGPCSICGAWYDVMQGTDDGLFLYCPHCGAKMEDRNHD